MIYIFCILLSLNFACQSRRASPVGPDISSRIQLLYQKIEASEFEIAWNQIKELKELKLTPDQRQNLNLAEARYLFLINEIPASSQKFQELIKLKDLLNLDNQKILKFYLLDLYDAQGNLNLYLTTLQELDTLNLNVAESFLKEAKKSFAYLQTNQLKNHQESLLKIKSIEAQLLNLPTNEASRLYFEASYFNYSSWSESHYDLYLKTLNLMHLWRTQSIRTKDTNSPWALLAFKRTMNEWQQAYQWAQSPTLPDYLKHSIKIQKHKEVRLLRLGQLFESMTIFENLLPLNSGSNELLTAEELKSFNQLKEQIQRLMAQIHESNTPSRKGPIKELGLSPAAPSPSTIKDSP